MSTILGNFTYLCEVEECRASTQQSPRTIYQQDLLSDLLGQVRSLIEGEVRCVEFDSLLSKDRMFLSGYNAYLRAVDGYRGVHDEWCNTESSLPGRQHISNAVAGILNLLSIGAPPPMPMILQEGTIGAYWRFGEKYVSIDFEADGEFIWAGTDGHNFFSGTWNSRESFPSQLALVVTENKK